MKKIKVTKKNNGIMEREMQLIRYGIQGAATFFYSKNQAPFSFIEVLDRPWSRRNIQ